MINDSVTLPSLVVERNLIFWVWLNKILMWMHVVSKPLPDCLCSLVSFHLSVNHEGRWGTTDDFTTSFLPFFPVLHCSLVANSRPVHSLMLSSHLFLCLPCLLPLLLWLARWFWPDVMNGWHDHTSAVCVSLQWSGGLHVVWLPAGS